MTDEEATELYQEVRYAMRQAGIYDPRYDALLHTIIELRRLNSSSIDIALDCLKAMQRMSRERDEMRARTPTVEAMERACQELEAEVVRLEAEVARLTGIFSSFPIDPDDLA